MNRINKKAIALFLGYLVPALLGVIYIGVMFPSSDDMGLIPWQYKLADTSLFLSDITYNSFSQRFYITGYLFYFLSKIIALKYVVAFVIVISHILLFRSLMGLLRCIAPNMRHHLIWVLLIILCNDSSLIGGYHLYYKYYAPHYLAHPLVIMAITASLYCNYWRSALFLILSFIIHPLIGTLGVILVVSEFIFRKVFLFDRTNIVRAVVISVGCLFLLLWSLIIDYNPVKIMMFVRAPWHMSSKFIDPVSIINVLMVGLFMYVFFMQNRTNEKYKRIALFGFLALIGILFGYINQYYLISSILVLGNPFEMGPMLLSLFLVLACLFLNELTEKKMVWLALIILIIFPKSLMIPALLLACVISYFANRKINLIIKSMLFLSFSLFTLFALLLQKKFFVSILVFFFSFFLLWFVLRRTNKQKYLLFGMLILLVLYRTLPYMSFNRTQGSIQLNKVDELDEDFISLCRYIELNTSKADSFIIPPRTTGFQYLTKRSGFVSFKEVPLGGDGVIEWYKRLQILKVIDDRIDYRSIKAPIMPDWDKYDLLTSGDFIKIKDRYPSFNYIVTRKEYPFKLVYSNKKFFLYKI